MPTKTDQRYEIDRPAELDLTAEEVGRLSRPEREQRAELLLAESGRILDAAVEELITRRGRSHTATAVLFSGGNDSTVLAHAFRGRADLAIHANTGIGIEQTREFVRDTCSTWGLRLVERTPPTSYRELCLGHGFPGPGQHFKSYQRLKERAFLGVRAELVPRARSHRDNVVYLAGRRKDESERRSNVPLWEREGSIAWVSPLALWTKLDLNTYRLKHRPAADWNSSYVGRCPVAPCRCTGVPLNRVSELLHMSGECLCGSFAKRDELDEIALHFPDVAAEIRALEVEVHERCRECHGGPIPHERTSWGWGATRDRARERARRQLAAAGAMCGTC